MHRNNHHVKAVQVHESNEIYSDFFLYPCLTDKSTQELAMFIATLITIDAY